MLLPEPVRPIIPTFSPGLMRKLMSRKLSSGALGYVKLTSLNTISPFTFGKCTKFLPSGLSTSMDIIPFRDCKACLDCSYLVYKATACESGAMVLPAKMVEAIKAPILIVPSDIRKTPKKTTSTETICCANPEKFKASDARRRDFMPTFATAPTDFSHLA